MSSANLDSAALKGALSTPGLIREDVMNKIWDISKIPLPLTDLIGNETSKQEYKEWTIDKLAPPNAANAVLDGSDASGNDTKVGIRVGNHHQISTKVVRVSFRADKSDVIGRAKESAYQLSRRQQELRRDVETIAMVNQASVQDTGSGGVAGKIGGLPSWLATNQIGGSGSAAGGFNLSTKLTVARTVGAQAAVTETRIRDGAQAAYSQGGEVSILMSTPAVIRKISEYLMSATASGARVAQTYNVIDDAKKQQTASGSINVFVSDFGTLKFVPNRLQPSHADSVAAVAATTLAVGQWYIIASKGTTTDAQWIAAGDKPFNGVANAGDVFQATTTGVAGGNGTVQLACADIFLLDPEYMALSYLQGYRSEELAKTGLAMNWQMSVDWALQVNNEAAHAMIGDVNQSAAMTF